MPFSPPSTIGDIIAIADLVHKICKALDESTGSSSDFISLIDELNSFEALLRHSIDIPDEITVNDTLRQNIETEAIKCRRLLEKIQSRIKGYEIMVKSGIRDWSVIWRKVIWGLWRAEEVDKFRDRISAHKASINGFLVIVNIHEGRQRAVVQQQQQQLPPRIGYGFENALFLIDALGRGQTLSMDVCYSQERFHDFLNFLFKGKIGEMQVKRHDYYISTEDGNITADSKNWGTIMKKATVVVMSMIVKVELEEERAERQKKVCPRCDETDVGVMPDDGWLECRRCTKRFRCVEVTEQNILPARDEDLSTFRNVSLQLVKRQLDIPILSEDMFSHSPGISYIGINSGQTISGHTYIHQNVTVIHRNF